MPRGGTAITVQPFPGSFPESGPETSAGPGAGTGAEPEAPPRRRPRPPRIGFGELRRLLAEDYATHDRTPTKWTVFTPGFQALLAYRLGVWSDGLRPAVVRVPVRAAVGFLRFFVRNFYGIELFPTARIGRRLAILHQSGIVIAKSVVIGDDCVIRQGVTIGGGGQEDGIAAPRIGDRVKLGAGAFLGGRIRIGDDAVIGPNAVVMTDVPAGSMVTAPPSRIMTPPPRRARPAPAAAAGEATSRPE